MIVQTLNPATEQKLRKFTSLSDSQIEKKLQNAEKAFHQWKSLKVSERLRRLSFFFDQLKGRQEELALLMTREMGKPITQSRAEINKSLSLQNYLLKDAEKTLSPFPLALPDMNVEVHRFPLGPLLGIMPWNFPLWQVVRFCLPALTAGNVVLIKHAQNVWGSSALIEELFGEVFELPVFQDFPVTQDQALNSLKDFRIKGVSLTGSLKAGMAVGGVAGTTMKKSVFELGGSDPYIICEDASVAKTAKACAAARLVNSGQSCVAAKRFFVSRKKAKEFIEAFRVELSRYKIGDPENTETQIGPLARKDLRAQLHRQLQSSLKKGAKLLLGGKVSKSAGFFYPVTLISHVKESMSAFREETFGPLAAVIETKSDEESFSLANRHSYALGAAVFSEDIQRVRDLSIQRLDCGLLGLNRSVQSHPEVPFGGLKNSGFGRELGEAGLVEFTYTKAVSFS